MVGGVAVRAPVDVAVIYIRGGTPGITPGGSSIFMQGEAVEGTTDGGRVDVYGRISSVVVPGEFLSRTPWRL